MVVGGWLFRMDWLSQTGDPHVFFFFLIHASSMRLFFFFFFLTSPKGEDGGLEFLRLAITDGACFRFSHQPAQTLWSSIHRALFKSQDRIGRKEEEEKSRLALSLA